MASKKQKRLEATLAFIRGKWGSEAIRPGRSASPPAEIPHIPTGFTSLDRALTGIGGIPRSRLTEILGAPTSGMTTLALKVIVNAQAQRDRAVYVDLGKTFDPDYAARCDVNLSKLLVVRPHNGQEALEIVQSLVRSRGLGVLVFGTTTHLLTDPPAFEVLPASLSKLLPPLTKSPCAVIFLTSLPLPLADFALPYATLRLRFEKERWLNKGSDIRGYEAQIRVLTNKLGPAGRSAKIAITFNGVVKGDAT
jgi:recombination protein RecA